MSTSASDDALLCFSVTHKRVCIHTKTHTPLRVKNNQTLRSVLAAWRGGDSYLSSSRLPSSCRAMFLICSLRT